MNVIVNYSIDKATINNLNEGIAEFKETLIIESIRRLNIIDEGKRKVTK